ncbi:MAG: T9SS type A sorting domain-containing protein [Ginsengibacter sp.]
MKILIFTLKTRAFVLGIILIFFLNSTYAQQSLISVNGWNAYVHVPWDYNSNPSQKYATIIFIPGLGEVGTNASAVILNGPGAYIAQGWNGNVQVGRDSVKFIIISLQPPSSWPTTSSIDQRIQTLKSLFRIDKSKMHLTGLSMGGWAAMCYVTADPLEGPYTYASQVASVVSIEGVTASDNAPFPQKFNNMALYGGKMINFEQINDYRLGDIAVAQMNTAKTGTAQYIQTDYSGGGHCCWEQFYGGAGVQPNQFLIDGLSQNIYQWIARNPQQVNGALPVTLQNFAAKNVNENVNLQWSTSYEKNSNYFEIQRSTDGNHFSKIGMVYTAGNSTLVNNYNFDDKQPAKGMNYYRLSSVDLDGRTSFSKIVSVTVKVAHSFSLSQVHLNKDVNNLLLNINSDKPQNIRATIMDVSGRVYFSTSLKVNVGTNSISKELSNLGRGIYFLKVATGDELITTPLLAD